MQFISLFSGAMGLDLGLEKAGFECAVCVEHDPEAVGTIRYNRPHLPVIERSITEVSGTEIAQAAGLAPGRIPLIVGGPPCQAFSVFGQRKGLADERGRLIFEFLRVINELRPDAFLMENVRGILSMPLVSGKPVEASPEQRRKGALIQLLFERFNAIGYRVDAFVVNAANYGAPQVRERVLLIGNRHGLSATFPAPTHSNRPEDGLPPFRTLGEAIDPNKGFIDPCPELMNFSPRKLSYLAMVPPGGNWRSLPENIQRESMGKAWYLKGGRSAYWRRLSYDFPSPTVVTMPNHAGSAMCHPEALRAITVGEAAAIQEFPRDWCFQGTTAAKYRQAGNAVPIRLGHIAGTVLAQMFANLDTPVADARPENYTLTHLRPHVRTRTFWKNGMPFAGNTSYYAPLKINENQI